MHKIDKYIDRLLTESEQIDNSEETQESLVKLNQEIQNQEHLKKKIQEIAAKLQDNNLKRYNTTDPECVITKSRQGTHAGYNAQSVVDEKNGLIVHTEALSHSQDYNKFNDQITKASEDLPHKPNFAVSDCGYYSLQDLAQVDPDITIVMPSIIQAQKEKDQHPLKPFSKEQFQYDKEHDCYICPVGKQLRLISQRKDREKTYRAQAHECRNCRFFGVCTKSRNGRVIMRLLEEAVKEKLEITYRSSIGQAIYKLRKQKIELTFGPFKRNLGAGHFLLKGRAGATAELSLLATSFNVTRMMTLLGISNLLAKLAAKQAVLQPV